MEDSQLAELQLEVCVTEATIDQLDSLTRQLLSELREMDVVTAQLSQGGVTPPGSKAVDAITVGSIAITVLPTILPKIVEAVQAWALRGDNRTVKFKGKVRGQAIEFDGSGEDFQSLLTSLSAGKAEARRQSSKAGR